MCKCNCKCVCVVPGEIREQSSLTPGPTYAIRDHANRWIVVSIGKGNAYTSHDHALNELIDNWPVVYRPA